MAEMRSLLGVSKPRASRLKRKKKSATEAEKRTDSAEYSNRAPDGNMNTNDATAKHSAMSRMTFRNSTQTFLPLLDESETTIAWCIGDELSDLAFRLLLHLEVVQEQNNLVRLDVMEKEPGLGANSFEKATKELQEY